MRGRLAGPLVRELAVAGRRLAKAPLFTAFAVISLAVGLGVTTAVYAILHSLLWTPSGIRDAERVVVLKAPWVSSTALWRGVVSPIDADYLQRAQTSVVSVESSIPFAGVLVDAQVSKSVRGEATSGGFLQALGVGAALGRPLQPADNSPEASPVIVLSHRFWRAALQSDPAVVGRTVRLGGQPFLVVGVLQRSFDGLASQVPVVTDAWIPMAASARLSRPVAPVDVEGQRRRRQLTVMGRLVEGRSAVQAAAEFGAIGRQLDQADPVRGRLQPEAEPVAIPRRWTAESVEDLLQRTREQVTPVGQSLVGLVALVLVVACTNLANLVLARGAARRHEFLVRTALGASRWRVIREQLAETLWLCAGGAVGAWIMARLLITAATMEFPANGRMIQLDPQIDLPVLAMAASALVLSLLVVGVGPAWRLTDGDVRSMLAREGAGQSSGRWRGRRALIGWQVAAASILLIVGALLVRLVTAHAGHDPGIDLDRLAAGRLTFVAPGWEEGRARRAVDDLISLASRQPDVEEVAVISGAPFGTTGTPAARFTTPDQPFRRGRDGEAAYFFSATPGIFRCFGIDVVRGRPFDTRDESGAAPVVVLSERMARSLFGTIDVVGRRVDLRVGWEPGPSAPVETRTVVGVVSDTDTGRLYSRESGIAYVPFTQHYEPRLFVFARTADDPADLAPHLFTLARQVDPEMAIDGVGTATMVLAGEYVLFSVLAAVASTLAGVALLLAMAGLYGVLSHLVSQRGREMAVRLALGADPSRIRAMVLRQGLVPVAEGLVVGLVLGTACELMLRSNRGPLDAPLAILDPAVLASVLAPPLIAGFVACYVPARRASRANPVVALKEL